MAMGPGTLEAPSRQVVPVGAARLKQLAMHTEVSLLEAHRRPPGTHRAPQPGWTAGDVVAHVLSLESRMHGDPLLTTNRLGAALPHVTNDFQPLHRSRSTGIGADRDVVLAELREIVEDTTNKVLPTLGRSTELMDGPGGMRMPGCR